MEYWKLIILGVVGLLVVAVLIEAWLKRENPRSSLSDTLGKESKAKADDKVPLGMEEIDMDVVRAAERLNTNLERKNTIYRK
ncbi:MAG: hypothetical protein ACTSRN_02660 [Alphaproteobacteria bacterium]